MALHFTPNGSEGHAVEVKGAKEVGMRRDLGLRMGWTKKIESEFNLRQELTPEMDGEGRR